MDKEIVICTLYKKRFVAAPSQPMCNHFYKMYNKLKISGLAKLRFVFRL